MRTRINQLKKQLRNERGLTLVELLAVIVILAIVAIIAFVFIGGVIENSKKDAHIANAQQVINAAKMHEATGGSLDGEGEDTVTVQFLQDQKYLEEEILDPWTKKAYEAALNATITVDGNELKIENFVDNSGENCSISATETELVEQDRKELCE